MTKKDFSITILSTRSGMIVIEIGEEFLGLSRNIIRKDNQTNENQ